MDWLTFIHVGKFINLYKTVYLFSIHRSTIKQQRRLAAFKHHLCIHIELYTTTTLYTVNRGDISYFFVLYIADRPAAI